jgi:hypothetical protein
VQASGTSSTSAQLAKLTGKGPKVVATDMTVLWRNRPDYLPDPSHNGEMCAGIAGQLFLYGPGMQFAQADGTLMITLFDETPRLPGQEANKPEVWAFDKDTLRKFVTVDERFGKSYALFLPWPTYRADITKIRMAVRYDPEEGHSLYVPDTKITIDTSVPGAVPEWSNQVMVPGAQSMQPGNVPSAIGGAPPAGFGGPGSVPGNGPGLGMIPSTGAVQQLPVPTSPTGQTPSGSGVPYGTLPPPPPNYGVLQPVPPGVVPGGPQGGPVAPVMPTAPLAPGGPGGVNQQMPLPPDLPPIAIIAPRQR